MTVIRRPSPFGDLMSLRSAMNHLFEDSFVRPRTWTATGSGFDLALDVYSDADVLTVEAAMPGVQPEDVDITITGSTLTIAGAYRSERQLEQPYLVQEIRRGSFSRTVTLPDGLMTDSATATFDNGILRLRLPKAEVIKPRQIKITPTASTNGSDSPAAVDSAGPDSASTGSGA